MGNMSNKEIGEKYGIHPRDVEKIKFAFEVYDFKGDGKVDAFYIGDLIRACNLNPTNNTIIHQFFSLFKKWKKRKTKLIIQEDARPFQKKQKQKLIEQKHPKIYISMQTKSS